jgi:tRNA threonylcarbamoyladenosine dehydratase
MDTVVDTVVDTAADRERRFASTNRLYGLTAAAAIRAAHVVVVGIGGVGSWAAEALARSGVGTITLIDMDHIAESNINRQVHAITPTLGQAKIEAMRDRIALINPACTVHCVDDFVDEDNWLSLLPTPSPTLPLPPIDGVIDACDQMRAKTAMAAWAMQQKIPFVSVGAAGGKRLAHAVDMADLSAVTHDPLLAQLRYRLRKFHRAARDGKKIGVSCVFSRETVRPADASCTTEQTDHSLNCHGYGSSVAVTGSFGFCAAGWIIEKITEISEKSFSHEKFPL